MKKVCWLFLFLNERAGFVFPRFNVLQHNWWPPHGRFVFLPFCRTSCTVLWLTDGCNHSSRCRIQPINERNFFFLLCLNLNQPSRQSVMLLAAACSNTPHSRDNSSTGNTGIMLRWRDKVTSSWTPLDTKTSLFFHLTNHNGSLSF